jgi:RNA polymerase sigma factor (sigma-70 family)
VSTAQPDLPELTDLELITQVRSGTVDAYGDLYERHVGSAYRLARQLSRSTAEADDLVAEAFAKVLDTLRDGRGPDSAFRAYLLTALRHIAYDKTRHDRKLEFAEDVTEVGSTEAVSVQFKDTAVAGLERSLAAKAFARLPERWQAVLWHTEIEGMSPADVAPMLELSANGVSALAYRAREGLRQAYLQVHLAESTDARCWATVDRLGAWTRGGLSKRETAQVETHLDECERCRALAAELADVNGALRAVVAPLVLGVGAAGYFATIGASTAKAAAGLAVGTTAGAPGGTAGTGSVGPARDEISGPGLRWVLLASIQAAVLIALLVYVLMK